MSTVTTTTTLADHSPEDVLRVIADTPQPTVVPVGPTTTERTDAGQAPYSYTVTTATIVKV